MKVQVLFNQTLFRLLFVISIGLVFWGIFRSTPPKELFEQSDKAAHFIAFAGLSFTGRIAMPKLNAMIYWPVMAGLAFSLEYLQGFVQVSRLSSIEDGVANLAGVAIGALAVKIASRKSYE
ncbi:MAG: VanZ family protein [Oceanospirillaceae bacterium]